VKLFQIDETFLTINIFFLFLYQSSHKVFHGFGQAKFAKGDSISGSIQFLSQLTLKTTFDVKKVKIDFKKIISL